MSLKAASTVNLRHIRAFLAVAQLASFTRAADRLSLSQPALTICIRQLEDLVGVALFNRTTRRVRLTKAGEDFLPTAERLIHDFEAAIDDVRAIAERRHGRVSLATISLIATRAGYPPSWRSSCMNIQASACISTTTICTAYAGWCGAAMSISASPGFGSSTASSSSRRS